MRGTVATGLTGACCPGDSVFWGPWPTRGFPAARKYAAILSRLELDPGQFGLSLEMGLHGASLGRN